MHPVPPTAACPRCGQDLPAPTVEADAWLNTHPSEAAWLELVIHDPGSGPTTSAALAQISGIPARDLVEAVRHKLYDE